MEDSGIALIAGLGNPGNRHAGNRHNVGFRFVERLQHSLGFSLASEKRYNAEVGQVNLDSLGGRVLRVMVPNTFMNLSGQAIAPLAAFYRIAPSQILIVHDELDLAPGDARLKISGGHGGHNGLRDIIARLGSSDFVRLRIGIGGGGGGSSSDSNNNAPRDVSSYVLSNPDAHDQMLIEEAMDHSLNVLEPILAGDFATAMEKLHRTPKPSQNQQTTNTT